MNHYRRDKQLIMNDGMNEYRLIPHAMGIGPDDRTRWLASRSETEQLVKRCVEYMHNDQIFMDFLSNGRRPPARMYFNREIAEKVAARITGLTLLVIPITYETGGGFCHEAPAEPPKPKKVSQNNRPLKPVQDIEFLIVEDKSSEVIEGARITVSDEDGIYKEGATNSGGHIIFRDFRKGSCQAYAKPMNAYKPELRHIMGVVGAGGQALPKSPPSNTQGSSPPPKKPQILLAQMVEHRVKTGETLDSIAQSYHLTFNELAFFNWGTYDRKKIIDGAKRDIGAKTLTQDGKDLAFHDNDQPGILFVPQPVRKSNLKTGMTHTIRVKKYAYKNRDLQIGLFFDGTGNDDSDPTRYTNVKRLHDLYDQGKIFQERIYLQGVGTKGLTDRKMGGAFGWYGDDRLKDAFKRIDFLIGRYISFYSVPPEKIIIDLFGFSRGASLARHFTNLVYHKKIRFQSDESNSFLEQGRFKVRFLGIFDTVGSFGVPGDNEDWYELHVDGSKAKAVHHMVAEDEKRENFGLQSLIPGTNGRIPGYEFFVNSKTFSRTLCGKGGVTEEIWPGVHSDVGGGYPERQFEQSCGNNLLSLVYLRKMHAAALKHDVPLNPLQKNKAVDEVEDRLNTIDTMYQKYPRLYWYHLQYKCVRAYQRFCQENYKLEYGPPDRLTGIVQKPEPRWTDGIKRSKKELTSLKDKMIQYNPGLDYSELNYFLNDYEDFEISVAHISHNPFNMETDQSLFMQGIGMEPYEDDRHTVLKRIVHLNFIHKSVNAIKEISV